MSKILKITLIFAALLSAFVLFPLMALQASTASQPAAGGQAVPALAPNAVVTITILHTNDFHGQLEALGSCTVSRCDSPGIAKVSTVISQVRTSVGAANVLLVDAGDEMQGSLISNLKKGQPTIDLFNYLGYQAATFGNHEFDWGQQVLYSRTLQADYPFLAANVVVSNTGSCASAGWDVPTNFEMQPWMTMTVGAPGNQAVVGLIGVASVETPYITIASATDGLCLKDPADSIAHHYSAIKAAGADVIIVISHNGFNDGGYGYGFTVYGDKTLANKLYEKGTPVDLIIGGHSHTDVTTTVKITNTLVTQAAQWGRKVGRVDLVLDTNTDTVITSTYQSLPTWNATPDPDTANYLYTNWTSDPAYQAQIKEVFGWSNVNLIRNYNGNSLMADFVDDAILNDLNNDANPNNDADIFFQNPGGVRADITNPVSPTTPFSLTYGMLFTVLPFGNQTIVGDLTGAQIYDLLQQSATLFKGALQPAGLRYTFYSYTDTLASPAPQPYAWGAYSITVRNRANPSLWEPLVMTKTYRVATNEFLAPAGGDSFSGFKYMTNFWYSGDDQLNGVLRWVTATYTVSNPFNGTLDGRITRNGTNTYNPSDPTQVVPVTVLHHNDPHGRLLDYLSGSTTYPGYTRLATLINRERDRNVGRTLLLNAGDTIQGDTMMAYFKTSFTGKASDGTTLPITLTTNPIMAAMNAMTYTAMTLGNHEFNFGNTIFTNTLKQANFPILQANLYDDGQYGLGQVPVKSDITVTLPGPSGDIKVAVLGIGNHRVPQYEMASDIPGLTFTNPVTETQNRAPALKAANDAVIALTHIGFTTEPGSVEVDNNVDTYLAANTTGVDTIIGGHSHTDPSKGQTPYKFLPAFVGSPDNTPVLINQAYRYNNYLGEVVLGLLPDGSGGYDVVSRVGRYIKADTAVAEDPTVKAIVQPYDAFLTNYKNQVFGHTLVPIDTLPAYTQETNGANLQVDASLWKLNKELSPTIHVGFHLSGAMTNARIGDSATVTDPYTMTVGDMFTLMPYENALVVFRLNGPQLKTILERGYRNYYYYKYVPGYGGYSRYPTCMLDINSGGKITYRDAYPTLPSGNNVAALTFGSQSVNFLDATTYYTVSTVNYIAAGSCNFNDSGVTLWPPSQLVASTQYYVRDVVIEYVPTLTQPIAPAIEGRLQFLTKFIYLPIILR